MDLTEQMGRKIGPPLSTIINAYTRPSSCAQDLNFSKGSRDPAVNSASRSPFTRRQCVLKAHGSIALTAHRKHSRENPHRILRGYKSLNTPLSLSQPCSKQPILASMFATRTTRTFSLKRCAEAFSPPSAVG